MDRVERALVAALFFVALWSLLGAQGARIGSVDVPPLSPFWVVAAAAAILLFTRERPGPLRGAVVFGIALALSFFLVLSLQRNASDPKTSLVFVVDSEREVPWATLMLQRRSELFRLSGKRRNVTLETRAVVEVPRSGSYVLEIRCDDSCEIALGEDVFQVEGNRSYPLRLARGDVPLAVRYRQRGGPAQLLISWDTPSYFELLPFEHYVRAPGEARRGRWPAHGALVAFCAWFVALGLGLTRLGRTRRLWIAKPAVPLALAGVVALYGGALRFEALLAHSGLAESDSPLASVHESLLPWLPAFGVFNPENAPEDPYRADVRSYLDRAESMSIGKFYAPSFREPFYVLLTRMGVAMAGGEIGILIQSFFFSCLTLPLFFIVARRLYGAWWALALLVPVSLHEWLVLEAPTGYRMSTYSFFLLGFAAFVTSSGASRLSAVLGGVLSGLLTLIRLSALSAIAPALALRSLALPRGRRLLYAGAFSFALAVLVAPFLLSNYRAHGDPLYSISFHTEFWLRAEGLDRGQGPVSLTSYVSDFGRLGEVAKGTFLGLTVLPLRTFWNGLRFLPALGVSTLVLGALGLFALRRDVNRYLAAVYFGHLLPFAYIQNFPSGEMPRFVMPAFFLLVLGIPAAAKWISAPFAGPEKLDCRPSRLGYIFHLGR